MVGEKLFLISLIRLCLHGFSKSGIAMRLDSFLVLKAYCSTREKAKRLIEQGCVFVNGKIIKKVSFDIYDDKEFFINVYKEKLLVSRAGEKLRGFFEEKKFLNGAQEEEIFNNKNVLDVGSSAGGFTHILLQKGAKSVTCVDVGSDQLDETLRKNPRVTLFERCDIRDFVCEKIFDLVVCDVSFISLSKILPSISILSDEFILLFKPQFEVGRSIKRSKKGVILDKKATQKRLDEFIKELQGVNLRVICVQKSILKGKEGNEEFFIYAKKFSNHLHCDWQI